MVNECGGTLRRVITVVRKEEVKELGVLIGKSVNKTRGRDVCSSLGVRGM